MDPAMATVRVFSPVPSTVGGQDAGAPRLAGLAGRRIGFRIEWAAFDVFCRRVEERLVAEHGISGVKRWEQLMETRPHGRSSPTARAERAATLADFAGGLDGAITGLAG